VADSGMVGPRYFVNAAVDMFVIGGLAIAVFVLFRLVPSTATSSWLGPIGVFVLWSVSYPHFVSTSNRLYGSHENRRQYPMTALVTPIVFTFAVVGCFLSPTVLAPSFVKLFNTWSPYHFSGQTLGLTLLYARRSSFTIDRRLRTLFTCFILSTFVFNRARAETGPGELQFFAVVYPSFGLPTWVTHAAQVAMWVAGTILIVELVRRGVTTRTLVPFIVVLPAVAQFVWFATVPIRAFTNLVPFFHSLQYLLIAWSLQLRVALTHRRRGPSRRFVAIESVRWMGINVAGGWALFWLFPIIGSHFGQSLAFSTAVTLAAIQLHHFFVDGVIWRLRSPALGSPLSSSLAELSGRKQTVGVGP
jgi:hypothetical protein